MIDFFMLYSEPSPPYTITKSLIPFKFASGVDVASGERRAFMNKRERSHHVDIFYSHGYLRDSILSCTIQGYVWIYVYTDITAEKSSTWVMKANSLDIARLDPDPLDY